MTAFVIVEMEVINNDAKDSYSKAAKSTIEHFGGKFITAGEWTVLTGQPGLKQGAVIEFESREKAVSWYESPEYQELIAIRDRGLNCRFRLIG